MQTVGMRTALRPRAALSVVEVLVALVLVAVGLLGMAGTSALALRSSADAAARHRATLRATSRLAKLSPLACTHPGRDTLVSEGMREQWSVAPASAGFALVDVDVEWRRSGSRRGSVLLQSAVQC